MSEKKRKGWWNGTKRDLEGASAAKERARSRADDQLEELAEAVRASEDAVEPTSADLDWEDVPTGVTDEMKARIQSDPILLVLFAKLYNERRRRANQVTEALGEKPPAEEIKALKWKVGVIWWLLIAAATAAGGSVFAVGKFLRTSGADAREHEMKHEQSERREEDFEKRIRAIEIRSEQNSTRITDHLTGHPGRRSDAAWPPLPPTQPPSPSPR
jgi:hypothetical protein